MYGRRRSLTARSILLLIAVNVLVYFAVVADRDLLFTLGLQPATWLERPWTILSNLFVHSGLWHLVANMITLLFFGGFLSSLTGEARFLVVYFVGGIIGNLVYILLGSPYSVAIGASGAVFALGGALAMMRPNLRVVVFPIPAPVPLWAAVIGGFAIVSLLPQVAWQAHLGGLVFGLVAGYSLRRRPPVVRF